MICNWSVLEDQNWNYTFIHLFMRKKNKHATHGARNICDKHDGKIWKKFANIFLIPKKNTRSFRNADSIFFIYFLLFFFFRLGTNTKHFETAGFYKQSFPWKVLSKSYKSIVKAMTQLNWPINYSITTTKKLHFFGPSISKGLLKRSKQTLKIDSCG